MWKITSIPRQRSRIAWKSRTSAATIRTFARPASCARFSRSPIEKSSTSSSSASLARRSARWLPMKPAAPVTMIRFPASFNACLRVRDASC